MEPQGWLQIFLDSLPTLLKTYWVLATGAVLVVLLPLPVPSAFRGAVRLSAMRGKLWGSSAKVQGLLQNASVPQRWFSHFYFLGSIVNLGCIALAVAAVRMQQTHTERPNTSPVQAHTWAVLFAFQFHLLRRYWETVYVMHYPPEARMHVVAYIFALSYYAAAPLSMLPSSALKIELLQAAASLMKRIPHLHKWWSQMGEAAWNGSSQLQQGLIVGGLAVFLVGNLLQLQSHTLLAQLAGKSNKAVGKNTVSPSPTQSCSTLIDDVKQYQQPQHRQYSIPHGGMFSLVSCPHYLAEIIIYLGLWFASGLQINQALMLAWVVTNLVLAAGETQAWYLQHFPDYPRRRKALLPWLF